MSVKIIASAEDFHSTIGGDKLVLVDYYADWCPPCRRFAPTLEQIAKDFPDVLIVAKVNVDQLEDVSQAQGIECMPTFIFYKNGAKLDKVEGADEKSVRAMVLKHK